MWLWIYYLHSSDFYVALGNFLAQVKFLYACVSYLSVALLHLESWEFANLGIFIICIGQIFM
jgi:hypothetical protein